MARVLVTGSSGFVGQALCRALVESGDEVIALSRKTVSNFAPKVFQRYTPDLPELPNDIDGILRNVDVVVHCAGRAHILKESSVDPLEEFRRVNTEGTLALARKSADAGVKRFIFVSTVGVNGSSSRSRPFREEDRPAPDSPYAQSKWEAEQGLMVMSQSTPMTIHIIRPPMIYGRNAPGNFALLAGLVKRSYILPFGSLNAPRSFVAIENVVDLMELFVHAASPPTGTYLVSDPTIVSTASFIREMADSMGLSRMLAPFPIGMLQWLANLVGKGEQIRKMAVPLAIDISSTCKRLGWVPPFTMHAAMRHALNTGSCVGQGKKGD